VVGLAGGHLREPGLQHLPEPGGVMDQGAWLMDACAILTRLVYRRDDAAQDG